MACLGESRTLGAAVFTGSSRPRTSKVTEMDVAKDELASEEEQL